MEIFICPKHGEYEGEGFYLDGREISPICPACDEEIEKKNERDKEWIHRVQMKSFNIEPEYYNATLENFKVESEEQKQNLDKTKLLVSRKIKKLLFTGPNGTGKTHLACAAVKLVGGKIITMFELSTRIRQSYTSKSESEIEILGELSRLPLLVIDEIGRTKGGEAEQNWLSYIVDKRHVRGLPLILITNRHTKKNCSSKDGCSECLEVIFPTDVISRFSQDGVLANFTGADFRKSIREAK